MTTEANTGISEGSVGRYVLDDLVAETARSQMWRAFDPALRRPVGARLIPLSDPQVPAIRDAARAAAKVHDRRVVQVLDVVQTQAHLAVITEWVGGRPWTELLAEAEEPATAVIVAYEVALALQSAHALGVTHGRIRPTSVIISDTNQVRLRGLGVDAARYGITPDGDTKAADLHGIGAILFAGLTGRWPEPASLERWVDGLPVVHPTGRRLPSPAEVTSGVPRHLSNLASACLLPQVRPRTSMKVGDVDHAVAALAREVERATGANLAPTDQHQAGPTRTDRAMRRTASAVLACIALAAALLLSGHVLDSGTQSRVEPVAPPITTPSTSGSLTAEPLPLASLVDFDPEGADRQENPDLVPLAHDGDSSTAWQTMKYRTSTMAPKNGTGLLIDLGLVRPMRAVSLQLLGSVTDVEIRASTELGTAAADFKLLAGAVAAGEEIKIRVPIPVQTRYVLVWLTNLPYQDGGYVGGIRDVQVLG